MVATFVRALQATDKFVGQISGLSTVAKVEAARVKVLCNLIEKLAPWTADDASEACAAINACVALKVVSKRNLLEHFIDKLVLEEEAVEGNDSGCGGPKAASKLQNYTNLALLLPGDLWQALLEPKRPSADCLMLLCDHAHKLGLLHPCERTCAAITCLGFWNLWRHGVALHIKQHTVEIAKVTIKSYLQHYEKQNPAKQCHVLKRLPKRVADLPPGLRSLFDKNPPGVVDDDALRHSQSMPCRRSHTSAGISAVRALAAVALDTRGKLVSATSLQGMRSQEDFAVAMLPAQTDESKEPLALCGLAEAETHDASKQVVLAEHSKPAAAVGIDAIKGSKRKHEGSSDVKSTLDDLKAKLQARKGVAEKSAQADKKTAKAKAKPKSKKVEDLPGEIKMAAKGVKSKVGQDNAVKEAAVAAEPETAVKAKNRCGTNKTVKKAAVAVEPETAVKAKKVKGRGKDLTADQKIRKPKGKGSKSKAKTTPKLSQEEISALIARVSLPKWFSCKKTLLEMFPEDTEKRYTSRCYHKVKDFEIQAGKSDGDAKALARAMHKHAKEMWISMFAAGSLST